MSESQYRRNAMKNKSISLALVDDQKTSLDRFADLISYFEGFQLRWKAQSGAEALRKMNQEPVEVILLDMEMPGMNGAELCQALREASYRGKIVMLSVSDQDFHLKQALKAGADGYLLKGERPETLIRMLNDSLEGRMAFSAEMAQKTLDILREPAEGDLVAPSDYKLSKRELEVLRQMTGGATYTDIADALNISPLTVRSHMENLYRKLGVHNKAEAINIALKHQWV